MKLLLTALLSTSLLVSGAAFADNHDHAEDAVVHYEAPKPATEAAAFTQLHATIKEIDAVIAKEKLADADFETVHEKSYALLSAVAKLEEKVPTEKKEAFAKLKHETEEVHEEAEEHNEAKLRKHVSAFHEAVKAYEGK